MEIICPNCGERISADNINIQKMAAVCGACHHVFQFDLPTTPKIKRRKVKQPKHMTVHEGENLHMEFRTNFRLDQDENFLTSLVMAAVFTFMTLIMGFGAVTDDIPFVMPLGFGLAAIAMYYLVALQVFNKTHIDVADEQITVNRKPLPGLGDHERTVNLNGIAGIHTEETAASKKEGYDTPRYVVRAAMVDGTQKVIVNDVTDDYADFITQMLNEYLEESPDVSHLADDTFYSADEAELEDTESPMNRYVNSDV